MYDAAVVHAVLPYPVYPFGRCNPGNTGLLGRQVLRFRKIRDTVVVDFDPFSLAHKRRDSLAFIPSKVPTD
jgi:hypothetical protein